MADLDTTSKRRSSVHLMQPPIIAFPEPTLVLGDINQADRQHLALMYSGILASGAAATVVKDVIGGFGIIPFAR